MKTEKPTKCVMLAFYPSGVKFRASLAMTVEEVEKEIGLSKVNGRAAKLDSVDEDADIGSSFLYFTPASCLFYNILVPAEKSSIVMAPANALPSIVK